MYFVRLLPLYVRLRLNIVHDRNGPNGPPGPDSDSSTGQRGRQLNDHSSQISRRCAGGGGPSTSLPLEGLGPPSSLCIYNVRNCTAMPGTIISSFVKIGM